MPGSAGHAGWPGTSVSVVGEREGEPGGGKARGWVRGLGQRRRTREGGDHEGRETVAGRPVEERGGEPRDWEW